MKCQRSILRVWLFAYLAYLFMLSSKHLTLNNHVLSIFYFFTPNCRFLIWFFFSFFIASEIKQSSKQVKLEEFESHRLLDEENIVMFETQANILDSGFETASTYSAKHIWMFSLSLLLPPPLFFLSPSLFLSFYIFVFSLQLTDSVTYYCDSVNKILCFSLEISFLLLKNLNKMVKIFLDL